MKYFSHRRTGYFGAAVLAMGLLLWARFLLITGHPKTAMATPEAPAAVATTGTASSDSPSTPKVDQPGKRAAPHGSDKPSADKSPSAAH